MNNFITFLLLTSLSLFLMAREANVQTVSEHDNFLTVDPPPGGTGSSGGSGPPP